MTRILSWLTLSTPQSRLGAWVVLSSAIVLSPFRWLEHLSIYSHLGWHNAPSIGLTRAYWYLLHGRPHDAWAMNPLIFVVLAIGLPLLIADLLKLLRPSAH